MDQTHVKKTRSSLDLSKGLIDRLRSEDVRNDHIVTMSLIAQHQQQALESLHQRIAKFEDR